MVADQPRNLPARVQACAGSRSRRAQASRVTVTTDGAVEIALENDLIGRDANAERRRDPAEIGRLVAANDRWRQRAGAREARKRDGRRAAMSRLPSGSIVAVQDGSSRKEMATSLSSEVPMSSSLIVIRLLPSNATVRRCLSPNRPDIRHARPRPALSGRSPRQCSVATAFVAQLNRPEGRLEATPRSVSVL